MNSGRSCVGQPARYPVTYAYVRSDPADAGVTILGLPSSERCFDLKGDRGAKQSLQGNNQGNGGGVPTRTRMYVMGFKKNKKYIHPAHRCYPELVSQPVDNSG